MSGRPAAATAVTAASVVTVALLALLGIASAQQAGSRSNRPPASVADYLAAFAAAYRPGAYDAAQVLGAEAAARWAGLAMSPAVTFEQQLDWAAYGTLTLDLETEVRLPVYDSRAATNRALAHADLDAARAAAAAAHANAALSFFLDLATYATLTETATDLALVLSGTPAPPRTSDADFDPRTLHPNERGPYEAHLRLNDMHAFLTERRAEVATRLSRVLALPADRLAAPTLVDLRAAVPAPPDHERCQERAPEVTAAYLRHRQASLVAALERTPAVTVDLTGDLGITLATAPTATYAPLGPTPTATFALEARVLLPPGGPVGSDVDAVLNAAVSTAGVSQSLRLAWPRPPLSAAHPAEQDRTLADELAVIAANLLTLRRAVDQAAKERARLERALAWSNLDAAPAAHTADLQTQLAFAELDEVISLAQLASACGAWP